MHDSLQDRFPKVVFAEDLFQGYFALFCMCTFSYPSKNGNRTVLTFGIRSIMSPKMTIGQQNVEVITTLLVFHQPCCQQCRTVISPVQIHPRLKLHINMHILDEDILMKNMNVTLWNLNVHSPC